MGIGIGVLGAALLAGNGAPGLPVWKDVCSAKPLLTILTGVPFGLAPALRELTLLCPGFLSISPACCSNVLSTSFLCLPAPTSLW